ncbi:MAG: hypothetical protein LBM28_05500 [Oscillospiraceae bacterium]|nr:hypothetical protein [Oscillospiraceae bacterium]
MKKQTLTNRSYYFLSLCVIALLSFYPLMMGVQILTAYLKEGYVHAADYPKYVIPYTPIAIALILSAALLPLAIKACKKFALLALSVFGTGAFLLFELLFEQVTVFSIKEGLADVGSWQSYLCIATPEVVTTIEYRETIGASLAERYSPVFKIHFYLIAILIVLAVIGLVYGYAKMIREKNYARKRPLLLQTTVVCVFIGLCIWACFTAFYRTGEINISPVSSWLMSVFFIVFGMTAGSYAGSLLYFKKPLVSRLIPAIIAVATTFAMYVGELFLMGGELFRFGSGFLFKPLGNCPFAWIDFAVIVASGAITYFILAMIRKGDRHIKS